MADAASLNSARLCWLGVHIASRVQVTSQHTTIPPKEGLPPALVQMWQQGTFGRSNRQQGDLSICCSALQVECAMWAVLANKWRKEREETMSFVET